MNADQAIAETTIRAKQLLLDERGKLRGVEYWLAERTLTWLIRRATPSECVLPGPGICLVEWDGSLFIYDQRVAELLLHDAHNGDTHADRTLCNAAALLLGKTGGISDPRLRDYAARRLSSDLRFDQKKGRGRNADDNYYRDSIIAGRLIPPLLPYFHATRNAVTKPHCACSIVAEAVGSLRINVGERRIAEIWGRVSHLFPVADK